MSWILVVDDDEDIRDTIESLLKLKGYQVRSAAGGKEGLQAMRSNPPPAMVILDYMMPGMNGDEFRAAQLGDPALAGVPVVLLTGAGDVASTSFPQRIAKPIDLQVLFETVGRYLGSNTPSKPSQ